MKAIRLVIAALMLAVMSVSGASAASYSTDQSDLWWADPPGSENGWGFQLVQRGFVIFATMFVYGPSSAPTWYTATMTPNPPGSLAWSGDLYVTSGSWFGTVPYNAAQFTTRIVGRMTWTPTSVNTGMLSYAVDGVPVTKNAIRQTLVNEDYSGHFAGGFHETDTACANSALNGTTESIGVLNIVQSGAAITVTSLPSTGGSCAYAGMLTQYGQMGDVVGSFSCSNGSRGTFHAFELQATEYSILGRFTASATVPAGCQASGWFGGLAVTTF